MKLMFGMSEVVHEAQMRSVGWVTRCGKSFERFAEYGQVQTINVPLTARITCKRCLKARKNRGVEGDV